MWALICPLAPRISCFPTKSCSGILRLPLRTQLLRQRQLDLKQNKSIKIQLWKFATIGIHLFEPFWRVQFRNTPNPGDNWYSDSNIFLQEPSSGTSWYFWQEAWTLPSLCRRRNLQLGKKRKWLLLIARTSPPGTGRRQGKRIYRIRRGGIDNCGC